MTSSQEPTSSGGCPVKHHSDRTGASEMQGKCPVNHGSDAQGGGARVPSSPGESGGKITPGVNPFNQIPFLSQLPAPAQAAPLSTERATSTIPKPALVSTSGSEGGGDSYNNTWEYPSPQQFYNALVRKGWETPVHQIPVMVDLHNFLNEAAWFEVLRWEQLNHCDCTEPRTLDRFQGRPGDLSPLARFYSWFGVDKPFDRHDWTVNRCGKRVRYVIDYYSGEDEPGVPVFHADIRPALDSPGAFIDRARMAASQLWKWMGSSSSNTTISSSGAGEPSSSSSPS